jgi:hypothetical protein
MVQFLADYMSFKVKDLNNIETILADAHDQKIDGKY